MSILRGNLSLSTNFQILVNSLTPRRHRTTRCLLCLSLSENGLCIECTHDLPWLTDACRRCALPLPSGHGMSSLCGACLSHPPSWDYCVIPLRYEHPVDRLITAFKYRRHLPAGHLLTQLLASQLQQTIIPPHPVLLPAPMSVWRAWRRGGNQTEYMAEWLQERIDAPITRHTIQRRHQQRRQAQLNRAERLRNLRQAFQVKFTPDFSHALIVDDVMTTGATAEALTRLLKQQGVTTVGVAALARTPKQRR